MKRVIPILLMALICAACSKPATTEEKDLTHEEALLLDVFRAIGDSTYSFIDYKDSFYELLDTMQSHVESYPDESVRRGAKSLAQDLVGLCMCGEFLSPEELQFFYDSLLLRFADVMATWYSPIPYSERDSDWRMEPVLTQCIVLGSRDTSSTKQFIYLDLYIAPNNDEVMTITIPVEAECLASIMFHKNGLSNFDTTASFNQTNAYRVLDETEDFGQVIAYGKELIDAMLTHDGMYIAYLGDEESDNIEDRFHDSHLLLSKFQEQYATVKMLLKDNQNSN